MINPAPRTIAIKVYWPMLKVAEHEVISRIEKALGNLNYQVLRIDENGYREDSGRLIAEDDALFVLDLHFQTPKVFPGISVAALWNPPDFHALFGLSDSLLSQFSHDLYAAANPKRAEEILSVVRPEYSLPVLPLNHTVPREFLSPKKNGDLRLFYIGIGWDNTAGYRGRHHAFLKALEPVVPLSIYGPRVLADGTKPWAGFNSYIGELPFDGHSVLKKANEAGLVIALSSESHRAAGIVSNRVFEAIAGGALPIVEADLESPFNLDEAIKVDSSKPPEEIVDDLKIQISLLESNREEFERRVLRLQEKMSDGFVLESQLESIIQKSLEIFNFRKANEIPAATLSLSSCLLEHLYLPAHATLGHEHLRQLSSPPFQRHLLRKLKDSNLQWVSLDGAAVRESRVFQEESRPDVLIVDGVTSNGSGSRVRSLPATKTEFVATKIVVSKDLVESWLSNQSGVLSVTLLWKIISLDFLSSSQKLKYAGSGNSLARLSDSQVYSVDQLLGSWDSEILSIGRIPKSTTAFEKLLFANAMNTLAKPAVSPFSLTYQAVLRALSEIPVRRLPSLAVAAIRHLLRF